MLSVVRASSSSECGTSRSISSSSARTHAASFRSAAILRFGGLGDAAADDDEDEDEDEDEDARVVEAGGSRVNLRMVGGCGGS
jgi:hypothetical protein